MIEEVKNFNELSVPTSKLEPWKYTSLKSFFKEPLRKSALEDFSNRSLVDPKESISSFNYRLVFINGFLNKSLSNLPSEYLKVFNQNDLTNKSSLPKSFSRIRKTKENISETYLSALNSSTFSELIFVQIPEEKNLSVEVSYISSETTKNEISSPRVFVELEKNAVFNLVENFSGLNTEGGITSHMVESFLEHGAAFNHYKLQDESLNRAHLSISYSEVGTKAVYKNVNINFGSALSRNEVYPVILGENACSWLLGINVVSETQHIDNFTCIDHVSPNCESHELYKGMYKDQSKGIFTGTIIVREEAQKTNAYQSNASLLCSDNAESISRPQLKIWADDVKCSHGATVGQLDEEALFYLRARGINEADARSILTRAYVCDVMTHLEDKTFLSNVEKILESKLSTF